MILINNEFDMENIWIFSYFDRFYFVVPFFHPEFFTRHFKRWILMERFLFSRLSFSAKKIPIKNKIPSDSAVLKRRHRVPQYLPFAVDSRTNDLFQKLSRVFFHPYAVELVHDKFAASKEIGNLQKNRLNFFYSSIMFAYYFVY